MTSNQPPLIPAGLGQAFRPDNSKANPNTGPWIILQAIRVALTNKADEPSNWTLIWYRPGTRSNSKGSGFRQYGGQHWYSDQNEAIARARELIATRPALTGTTRLEVEDDGYYGGENGDEWIIDVRVIPAELEVEPGADPLM